jgi:deoxyadenosine/deoxycytidine kinase
VTKKESVNKMPSHINYLCIEGVIGAGKTTLSRILSERFDGRIVLEEAEENPFLAKFYTERRIYAFQTQLWFLVSRYKQLSGMVGQQDLFHQVTISDYIFAKDRIFANINLEEDELGLYNSVSRVMETSIPKPDLVVYLQTSTDVLLKRIEKRGRAYEYNMDPQYLDILNKAYNHFFFHYTSTPLLIINTNNIDFVHNENDKEEIIEQIVNAKAGTYYYQPMGSHDRTIIQERLGLKNVSNEIDENMSPYEEKE